MATRPVEGAWPYKLGGVFHRSCTGKQLNPLARTTQPLRRGPGASSRSKSRERHLLNLSQSFQNHHSVPSWLKRRAVGTGGDATQSLTPSTV